MTGSAALGRLFHLKRPPSRVSQPRKTDASLPSLKPALLSGLERQGVKLVVGPRELPGVAVLRDDDRQPLRLLRREGRRRAVARASTFQRPRRLSLVGVRGE